MNLPTTILDTINVKANLPYINEHIWVLILGNSHYKRDKPIPYLKDIYFYTTMLTGEFPIERTEISTNKINVAL